MPLAKKKAQTMPMDMPSTQPFLDAFTGGSAGIGSGFTWLAAARDEGMTRFKELGFPTPKQEEWKYTKLRPLEDTQFRAGRPEDGKVALAKVPHLLQDDQIAARLVFLNGRCQSHLSVINDLPDGVTLECVHDTLAREPEWVEAQFNANLDGTDEAVRSLNIAMMDSGFVFRVEKGVVLEKPVEVVYIGGLTDEPVAYFPRNMIVVEEGAQATLVKHHAGLGAGAYFANTATSVEVGNGANFKHYKLQNESIDATHLSSVGVTVGRDATYESFNLSIGGRLSRNEVSVSMNGEGGFAGVNGAYMMKAREHVDTTTRIDHTVPNTSCREVFKGVLDDEARAVFQGKIVVHKDAQKTDGHQLSNALLLSDGAEMDAKPELEIYADDVKCSHGALMGQLDESSLFYLRSRGVPEAQARNMLIQSFLGEAVDEITHDEVREAILDRIIQALPAVCYRLTDWKAA